MAHDDPCADHNFDLKRRYEEYLKTQFWHAKRDLAYKRSGFKCEHCGLEPPKEGSYLPIIFDVHHLTYERLGYEDQEDLQVLCRNCHRKVHSIE